MSALLLRSRARDLSLEILGYLCRREEASTTDVAQSVFSGMRNGRTRCGALLRQLLKGGFVRQVKSPGLETQWIFVRELTPLPAEVLEECIPHLCAYATQALDEEKASPPLARALRHVRSIVAAKRLDEGLGHEDLDPRRGGLAILADEIEGILQAPLASTGTHA